MLSNGIESRRFGRRPATGAALTLLLAAGLVLAAGPAAAAGGFKAKGCIDCHKEHVDKTPTGNAHQPYAERNCEGCHRRHGVIGKLVMQADGRDLCGRPRAPQPV